MAKTVAAIRAANLLPLVRWLESNGHPAQRCLEEVDLGYWFCLISEDPIPLVNAIGFLRNSARKFGPDFGCCVIGESSVAELAFVGRVALGARTPYEAMQRVSAVICLHCAHETILVDRTETGVRLTETMQLPKDAESQHAIQVLLSAMIQRLCLFTGMQAPVLQRIEVTPQPKFDLVHLHRWFGDTLVANRKSRIAIDMHTDVVDRPF